jgi:hypothetical protein
MFDWLEYDNIVKNGYEEQEKQLSEFLEKFIAKNAQIHELPLFDRPDQETLDRIAATEIPVKGRDPIAVGEELVNDLQCRSGEKGAGKAETHADSDIKGIRKKRPERPILHQSHKTTHRR